MVVWGTEGGAGVARGGYGDRTPTPGPMRPHSVGIHPHYSPIGRRHLAAAAARPPCLCLAPAVPRHQFPAPAHRRGRHPWHPAGLSTSSAAISLLLTEIAPLTPRSPAGGTRLGRYLFLGFIQLPRLRRVWRAWRAAAGLSRLLERCLCAREFFKARSRFSGGSLRTLSQTAAHLVEQFFGLPCHASLQ